MDLLYEMMMEELILDVLLLGGEGTITDYLVVVPAKRAVGILGHGLLTIFISWVVGWMIVK